MHYKITIDKVTEDVPYKEREYEQIGQDDDGKPVYGYVYSDATKTVTQTVYEQTIDFLDIPDIVQHINQKNTLQ